MSTATMERPTGVDQPAATQITDPATQVWATSTKDQLRALIGLGYDWDILAGLLPEVDVPMVVAGHRHIMSRRVAEKVRAVFAELIRWPVPFGATAEQMLDYADEVGWGVVDMVAVRLALAGSTHRNPKWRTVPPLTPLEKRAVIHTGYALGYNATVLSRAAGASGNTVAAALDRISDDGDLDAVL